MHSVLYFLLHFYFEICYAIMTKSHHPSSQFATHSKTDVLMFANVLTEAVDDDDGPKSGEHITRGLCILRTQLLASSAQSPVCSLQSAVFVLWSSVFGLRFTYSE